MGRLIATIITATAFTGLTAMGAMASVKGWGLPGALEKPVSVRQGSQSRTGGLGFLYFGAHRRHFGGGFRGGK